MQKKYIVVYTTVDKQVREFMWTPKEQSVVEEILYFIDNSEWSEAAKVHQPSQYGFGIYWGLGLNRGPFDAYSSLWKLPNATQYEYYAHIAQQISSSLGKECVANEMFCKSIMKAATTQAAERDQAYLNEMRKKFPNRTIGKWDHHEKNALARAKSALNYRKKRYSETQIDYYISEQADIYANIIEQYNIFAVLEIIDS